MLVGRARERQVIEGLVTAARVGRSAVLVLTGEAGIGKSALLGHAASCTTGMRLLRATGAESESEVPFGGLLQLLRPLLSHLDAIPAPQADALAAALALRPGTGGDRFAVGAATLSLLSRSAQDDPLAVLVDDAHLLDEPSAQALVFAARRLTADPVLLVAAVRDGHPCPMTAADLPVLHVEGLSPGASGELVTATGRRLADRVAARLYEVTGGNPLALLELADDVEGVDALPPGAPLPVSASLARAFARRADRLSAPARTALLVAATSGGDPGLTARACRLLGVEGTPLDEAETADLVRVDADVLTFRHGLVRSAVYAEASPAERRAVHRALADALPEADVDRRAWHLGAAAHGPDEETARLLDAAATRARDRSAHAVAAGAFERAARLSPDLADRTRRLVSAAASAWQAGTGKRANTLLAESSGLPQPSALRVRAAGLRGAIASRTGSVEDARDVLMAAGTESADAAPDTAVLLFADAILACFFLADTATVADASARIDRLVERVGTDSARWVAAMAGGVAGVLTGAGGPERMRSAVRQVTPGGLLLTDPRLAPWLVIGPLFLRESGTGRELVETVVADLRRRSDIGGLPFLLFQVARDQATRDRWDVAEVNYTEGIQLAREAGHTTDLVACLAGLTWLEARQGRAVVCREHAAETMRLAGSRHLALFHAWSLFALGELELGTGRVADAISHLERLDRLLGDLRLVDVDLSPAPELVEAFVHAGRADAAGDLADRYSARARAKGQPWALARAARAVALTCPAPAMDEQFALALASHRQTLDVFELARTQLAHGARLRRARRRTDARAPLRAALATFESLGAAPWADQAAVELRATGETAHRRTASALDQLTPQELQIGTMLADGRTTREAATALFLSPKTVEYHLRHVYLKLGVASRAELSGRLAGPGADAAG
ncbi:AAA family ATPase [Modestobacter sp. DSM 44400]|uniref:ATP-binding protein n=1 Tax=Modestobacter sp. DSM 44400 TaxID=1550230 RepID=UPI000B89C56C|nr:helix-turn-helix transcriptional regulator [Modestobacter sp. DSM 44400]